MTLLSKTNAFLLLILLTIPLSSGCAYYLMEQTTGQMDVLMNRTPIKELLDDEKVSTDLKEKLRLSRLVLEFCREDMDLPTSSYRLFYDTGGENIAFNVSATGPLELVPITWWFPFVGFVPYLGFFDKSRAVALKYSLQAQGYDVVMGRVAAFSTLGWFEDPLLSKLLEEEVYTWTEVVIHEIAHQHIYVAGNANFNENIAVVIGEEGCKGFLKKQYGEDSPQYAEYVSQEGDRRKLEEFVGTLYEKLKKLYESQLSDREKLQRKKAFFQQATVDFRKLKKTFASLTYRSYGDIEWNNAIVLSFRRYRGYQKLLLKALSLLDGNLKKFVALMKKMARRDDPLQDVQRWVKNHPQNKSPQK